MQTLPKITSLAQFKEQYGETNGVVMAGSNAFYNSSFYPTRQFYSSVPEGIECEDFDKNSHYPTEANFWAVREALRFNHGDYKKLNCTRRLHQISMPTSHIKLNWHFAHQGLSDPEMVAFTPNHAYGLADRQVTMKLGKYLKKFYGDMLDDDQIRELANLGKGQEVLWAHGGDEIEEVYNNGPSSCMVGKDWGHAHPARAYGYQYEDGSFEFGLAHLKCGDKITARCLVSLKHKVWTRFYGDDGPVLGSKLEELGFEKVAGMGDYGLRLADLGGRGSYIIMPYLDGDDQYFNRQGDHYVWKEYGGEYCADCADGLVRAEDMRECDHCEREYAEDSEAWNHTYHSTIVCDHCCDQHFTHAWTSRSGHGYVDNDEVIECRSNGEYYLNDDRLLSMHHIVEDDEGDYWKADDIQTLHDGTVVGENVTVIECGEDDFGDIQYDDICNVDRDWYVAIRGDLHKTISFHHPDYRPDDIWIDDEEEVRNPEYLTIEEALAAGHRQLLLREGASEWRLDQIRSSALDMAPAATPAPQILKAEPSAPAQEPAAIILNWPSADQSQEQPQYAFTVTQAEYPNRQI